MSSHTTAHSRHQSFRFPRPASLPSIDTNLVYRDPNLVTWTGGETNRDVCNPVNWRKGKKWSVIVVVTSCCLCVTCNSSIVSATFADTMQDFHLSREVAELGLSSFMAGLGTGPFFLGPLSETFGRRKIYLVSWLAFVLLQVPVAFAVEYAAGAAGSAFLSVAGGTVTDLFLPVDLFMPMAFYTAVPFGGLLYGPLLGNLINHVASWRWIWRATLIWSGIQYIAILFFAPETYGPTILTDRARRLRKHTHNQRLYTEHERLLEQTSLAQKLWHSMLKVPMLLWRESMLTILCCWSALLLAILFGFTEAYPIIFMQHHQFTDIQNGLAFTGIAFGMLLALGTIPWWNAFYRRSAEQTGGEAAPEERLPMAMLGAFATVIGLTILAFTTYSTVHWIVPILASVPFGSGVLLIYIGVFTYIAQAWRSVAASAIGANTILRNLSAGFFPFAIPKLYATLRMDYGTGLLALMNVLMIPIPFLLYVFGPRIRYNSKYADY